MNDNIIQLAKNAKLGDGCFWKHPECRNYKLIFTSTNREWLEYKGNLINKVPRMVREAGCTRKGVYANSSTLYSLTTLISPVITDYKARRALDVLDEYDMLDFAWWYLDDGSAVWIHPNNRYTYCRYYVCIGNLCPSEEDEDRFLDIIRYKFRDVTSASVGHIRLNGSKASARNKVWVPPMAIGERLVCMARALGVPGFEHKLILRIDRPSTTIRKE